MIRLRTLIPLMLAVAPAAAFADGFAPGQWSHWTEMVSAEVPGVPQWVVKMFAGNSKRKSCYTPAQAASRPEALLTQDDAAVCNPRKFAMEGGKFVYDTFCTNKRFPDGLLISSKGTYTPNSYTIATTSTGTKDGGAVKIVTTGGGQRIGACK